MVLTNYRNLHKNTKKKNLNYFEIKYIGNAQDPYFAMHEIFLKSTFLLFIRTKNYIILKKI